MMLGKSDPDHPDEQKSNGAPSAVSDAVASPAPTPATSAQTDVKAARATFRYVDQPETAETFADSITGLFFDGQTLRIEFAVTRVDEVKPNTPISGRRYPICRLVLPPTAAIELINRMQQVGTALTQAGMAKPTQPAPRSTEPTKVG